MPAELRRIARETWPFVAGLLVGLAIGGVWTVLQPDRYRAETHVLLGGASAVRLASAVETLANGSVLEQNVKQTLRLSSSPDLSASVHDNVLTISAEAGSRERARQVDAEAAQVLTQLVGARFGSQGVQASLLDQAHVAEQTSPTPARNLLICALLGLVGGAGAAYLRSRHLDPTIPVSSGGVDPDLEHRLEKRVDEVTKRELALARRAGELAKREAELEQRRGQLDQLDRGWRSETPTSERRRSSWPSAQGRLLRASASWPNEPRRLRLHRRSPSRHQRRQPSHRHLSSRAPGAGT